MIRKKVPSTAITTRFTAGDHAELLAEAETRNTCIPELLRETWRQRKEYQEFKQILLRVEARLRYTNFEVLCQLLQIDANEKTKAREILEKRGIKW